MIPERFHRLRAVLDRRQPDLVVAVENVHKPHNLAAIVRTCDAVGVFEAHATTAARDLKIVRSPAQGTHRWVKVRRHDSTEEMLGTLKAQGLTLWAAHLDEAAQDFRQVDYTKPTAVLFGQERDGVSSEAIARCDGTIVVPMVGMAESLNVSVAAALVLFEAQRQRAVAGFYEAASRLDEEIYRQTLFEWAYPRLADLCRRKGFPYPDLDENGEILGPLPR